MRIGRIWSCLGLPGSILVLFLYAETARAQFLRVGPFDFTGQVTAGLNWSDNVDGLRPAEQVKSPAEDFSFVAGFSMGSDTRFGRNGTISLSAGYEWEDYFKRNDLDELSFVGKLRAETLWQGRVVTINPYYSIEQTIDSEIDQYIPGGNSLIQNPAVIEEFGLLTMLDRDPFSAGADVIYSRERYLKDRFKSGDNNSIEVNFFTRWQMTEQAGIEYRNENTRDQLVNDPGADDDWKTTETIMVDWAAKLWRRPQVTFSFGVEKEDTETEEGTWDPIYNVTISDAYQFGSRLSLSFVIAYDYETDPEEDDIIGLTFDGNLDHELGANARQRLYASREPRDTFGANADTDTTTYGYELSLNDVVLRGLNFTGSYEYEINRPPLGKREDIKILTLDLGHFRAITPRLSRSLVYTYTREESNLIAELLIENRVEWIYTYEL